MESLPDAAAARLFLLGACFLQRGSERFDLPDTLPGYLLTYLGARADWVAREHLAVLFWPDAAEIEAQRNLRVNLNRLRGLLAGWGVEALLAAERRRVRLQLSTDLELLREALGRANWPAAAALYRGPFCTHAVVSRPCRGGRMGAR
jgi:hypothetical protein